MATSDHSQSDATKHGVHVGSVGWPPAVPREPAAAVPEHSR
jgi:hypothetical protein